MITKSYLYILATCFILMAAENTWFMARMHQESSFTSYLRDEVDRIGKNNISHASDENCKTMLEYPDADTSFKNLDKTYPWNYNFKDMVVYQSTKCDD